MAGPGSCATGAAACIAADRARAFALGQLAPAERAAVEHRIAACVRCRATVAAAAGATGGGPAADRGGATAVQRPRRDAPTPAPPGPVVTQALRGGHDARAAGAARDPGGPGDPGEPSDDEIIELIGGRPAATAPDRPGAHRDPRNAPALPSAPDGGLVPGEVVGRYVVERPLGAGGMGVVSLARDPELRRPVVIKLVHPNMGHGEGGDELEARLRREAQAMAQVSHANVVQIFDIGRRGDRVFLAMEFISGRTFDVWLAEQPRSVDDILGMIRQAGAGLAAAHRAGLVHRDFKPTNVLVGNDGIVKVTDFGLARAVTPIQALSAAAGATRQLRAVNAEPVRGDAPTVAAPSGPGGLAGFDARPRTSGVHAAITQVDSVVGTPAYMAPEQAAGRALDARTDQYALAVTLLDALVGQSPSRRRIPPNAPPSAIDAALDDAGISSRVREAIVRALAEDPAARFPAIDDLLRALAPRTPRRSRRGILIGAGIALCGLAGAVWLVRSDDAPPECAASAPGRWAGAPRARVVAALSLLPRPFAGWDAERLATAVDRAADALGADEVARCRGTPPASGSATGAAAPDCLARRTTALTAAIAKLSASPPPDDPWALVLPIEQCEPRPATAPPALRTELATASAGRARQIAEQARKAGDDRLAADALEAAGVAALALGDALAAESDLRTMAAAGERTGDDAARGRALLHLVETARWRGEHADARRDLDDLHAMVARHGNAPRDELAVALVEAAAATDLGDVQTAFAAWDRARSAATTLGDRDAALAAAMGNAWSTYALRADLLAARRDATAALAAAGVATSTPGAASTTPAAVGNGGSTAGGGAKASGGGATASGGASEASDAAKAAALTIVADLAIADHDGAAATAALADAQRLDPSRSQLAADRIRLQRARALGGDVDAALADLADLASASTADPLTASRAEVARAQILLAADRAGEARDTLEKVEREVRGRGRVSTAIAMAVPERIELELALCEAQVATSDRCKASYQLDTLLKPLHPRAPVHARLAIVQANSDALRSLTSLRSQYLLNALDILLEAGAAPLQIAALRWQIAQLGASGADRRRLATAAREVFAASGKTAEVAEIDAWLGGPRDSDGTDRSNGNDPGAGTKASPADAGAHRDPSRPRDPWGPQP